MEKNDGKIVAVIALVIAVVALSVGFAAFADQLTISGTATIEKASDTFEGSFQYDEDFAPTCKVVGAQENLTLSSPYSPGTVSGDTWTGISVPLSTGAYSVVCTARVINTSAYTAYLTRLGVSGGIQCSTVASGANAASNTTAVCARVSGTVQIGSSSVNSLTFNENSTSSTATTTGLTASVSNVTNSNTETVTVTITFDDNNGAVVPDGDITVTLPTISHDYSTVQPTN